VARRLAGLPSVGATENILMRRLAEGTTVIDNAARRAGDRRPVHDVRQMGAKIDGSGSSTLTVHGVDGLQPTQHRVIGDRIVGATWAFAAAMTQGEVNRARRGPAPHRLVLDKLRAAGARTSTGVDVFTVAMDARPGAVDFVTLPFPASPPICSPWRSRCPPSPTDLDDHRERVPKHGFGSSTR